MSPQIRFWLEATVAGAAIVAAAPLVFIVTRYSEQHPMWWYLGYMAFVSIIVLFVLDRQPDRS